MILPVATLFCPNEEFCYIYIIHIVSPNFAGLVHPLHACECGFGTLEEEIDLLAIVRSFSDNSDFSNLSEYKSEFSILSKRSCISLTSSFVNVQGSTLISYFSSHGRKKGVTIFISSTPSTRCTLIALDIDLLTK